MWIDSVGLKCGMQYVHFGVYHMQPSTEVADHTIHVPSSHYGPSSGSENDSPEENVYTCCMNRKNR